MLTNQSNLVSHYRSVRTLQRPQPKQLTYQSLTRDFAYYLNYKFLIAQFTATPIR